MKKTKLLVKIILVLMIAFIILYSFLYVYAKYFNKIDIQNSNSIYMYDKDNKSFYEGSNGTKKWIELNNINKNLIKATIYSEDKNFYEHYGFDIPRIIKSSFINLKSKEIKQGASTITQQYARNLFLTFEKTWSRKIKEAWYAFCLEVQYSKKDILEGYLNTINYGNGILGIENASLYYFNKSSKHLSMAEATMLAGIPKSPNNYSPLNNEKKAKKRQKEILISLVNNKIINKKEMKDTLNVKLTYYGKKENLNLSTIMYYQDAIIRELEELKIVSPDTIRQEGLKIYTALDLKAQTVLEESIKNNMEKKEEMQVSAIVMNPNNGEIMALAGGKDYSKSQYNRAVQSKRQVGSAMKPFLYYSALENGLTAASTFLSKPTTFTLENGLTYSPSNYGDIYPNNKITMALAIAYSDNIYAIKTHLFLGENVLVETAKKAGISSKLESNASLPLGTNELYIDEFVSAYAALANNGYKIKSHLIKKVEDGNGDIIYKHKENKDRVLSESYTYILNELLSNTYDPNLKSYASPTCASIAPKITRKYAVKSGTTDYDLWTVGYNPDITVGVWTGYDDNRKLSNKEYKYAKNIWADTIENYLRDEKQTWYKKPDNVVGVLTDVETGAVATNESKLKKILYYIKGTEPGYKKTFRIIN
ncbi:MAG: PBP1A family penicillin-binding protein [Bacilli bacterium]